MSDYFWMKLRYPDLKTHCDFNNVPRVCTNLPALVDFEEGFKSSYLNLYLIFLLDSKFCLFAFLSQSLAFQNKIGETFYLFIFKQNFHSFFNWLPSLDLWECGIDRNVVNFSNIGGYVFLSIGKILVHYFLTGKFTGFWLAKYKSKTTWPFHLLLLL